MYKNQLQELAQRSCFNLPSYSCIREGPDHAPRFKATVNFNGEIFESPAFCTTLRQAEHAAAEVALSTLSKIGPSRSLAARVLDETGVYKNLLQETAHRAGLNLPVYTTVRSGPGHMPVFSCTVELGGMSFTGEPAKTKKQAQKNAAMAGWSALKQLPCVGSSCSSSSSPSLKSQSNDEQEQVTIARILSSLQPPDGKRPQHDSQRGKRKPIPVSRDKISSGSGSPFSTPYQRWSYVNSPDVAMFQIWQQQQQQQTCPLALQGPPPVQNPGLLACSPSRFPLNESQFFPTSGQEAGPSAPYSHHYPTTIPVPVSIRSRSQVKIHEISDENPMEDKQKQAASKETDSSDQIDFRSRNQSFQAIGMPGSHVKPRTLETAKMCENGNSDIDIEATNLRPGSSGSQQPIMQGDHFPNVSLNVPGQDNQREENKKEHYNWVLAGSNQSPIVPKDSENMHGDTGDARRCLGPRHFRGCSSQSKELISSYRGPPCRPMNLGSFAGRSIGHPRTMAPPVTIRSAIPVFSAKPSTESSNNQVTTANTMVPAVHIRSITPVPVCSAKPSTEGLFHQVPLINTMVPAVKIRSVTPVSSAQTVSQLRNLHKEQVLFTTGEHAISESFDNQVSHDIATAPSAINVKPVTPLCLAQPDDGSSSNRVPPVITMCPAVEIGPVTPSPLSLSVNDPRKVSEGQLFSVCKTTRPECLNNHQVSPVSMIVPAAQMKPVTTVCPTAALNEPMRSEEEHVPSDGEKKAYESESVLSVNSEFCRLHI